MDRQKRRLECGGLPTPNLGPWQDDEVEFVTANANVERALLNEAEVRALPLQTLHNYIQNLTGTLVATTGTFEPKQLMSRVK